MNDTLSNDLTQGPVRQQLLQFSFPIMLANLLQTVYSLVDMIIVGQFVGAAGLSAVGIGSMISMILLTIGMGLGNAGQILIAQQIGAGDRQGISSTIGTLFTLLAVSGLALGLLCTALCAPILNLLNAPAEAFRQAYSYTVICSAGLIFIYGYNGVSAVLRGMGESRLPMIIIGVASVLNLLLDLLFVAVFGMGAGGAALATVMSQALSFAAAAFWLYRRRQTLGFAFCRGSFRIRREYLSLILRLGVPYIIQGLMISISMAYINGRVNSYGITASAVDSIGQKLDNMLYIVSGGLATGSAAMIGQCFGARRFDRIRQVHDHSLALCMIFFCLISAVLLAFPTQLFGIFSDDAAVLAMAPDFMKITVLFFLSASTMVPPFSIIEGIGYAGLGLVIGLMDGVVARIGLGLLLEHFWGLYGLWIGNAAAGLVTTVLSAIYYHSYRWEQRAPLAGQPSQEPVQE